MESSFDPPDHDADISDGDALDASFDLSNRLMEDRPETVDTSIDVEPELPSTILSDEPITFKVLETGSKRGDLEMGKAKKVKVSKDVFDDETGRNVSLADQILEDKSIRSLGRTKERKKTKFDDEFVDEKLSRKILEQAREQQEELEDEHQIKKHKPQQKKTVSLGKTPDDDESQSDDEFSSDEEVYETIDVNEDDEKALQAFMSDNPSVRRTLADIIQEKITEKQTEIQTQMSDVASVQIQQLDERVVNMYRTIGQILTKYRSGKLPKPLKLSRV
ncbi:hypothetical protein ScPMuIL_017805 [Solemya velum]